MHKPDRHLHITRGTLYVYFQGLKSVCLMAERGRSIIRKLRDKIPKTSTDTEDRCP